MATRRGHVRGGAQAAVGVADFTLTGVPGATGPDGPTGGLVSTQRSLDSGHTFAGPGDFPYPDLQQTVNITAPGQSVIAWLTTNFNQGVGAEQTVGVTFVVDGVPQATTMDQTLGDPGGALAFNQYIVAMSDEFAGLSVGSHTINAQVTTIFAQNIVTFKTTLVTAVVSNAGGAQPAAPYSVVLQPGGVAGGNVYTDFPTLYAATTSLGIQGQVLVTVDDSLSSPVHIPAGSYAIGPGLNWSFTGIASFSDANTYARLNIDDGAAFTLVEGGGVTMTFTNVDVQVHTTADFMVTPANTEVNLTLSNSTMQAHAAGRFLTSTTGFGFVQLMDGTGIGDGAHAVFDLGSTATGELFAVASFIQNNSIAGGGTINYDSACTVSQVFGGGFTVIHLSKAQFEAYTAASSPNWNGSPPTTVAAALDRIAAHVGPVP